MGARWSGVEAATVARWRAEGKTCVEMEKLFPIVFGEERSAQAIKDSFRRNEKVRAHYLGSEKGPEELSSNLTIEAGDGPVGEVKANRPRSASEMAELFDIDTDKYIAEKVVTNQWARYWQTKVWWRINLAEAIVHNNFDELITVLMQISPFIRKPLPHSRKMRMIHVPDAHHGALSWGPETGADMDLGISIRNHNDAYYHLLDGAPVGSLICYVLGHDLFHYDRMEGGKVAATFKGTPQDSDGRWQKMFNEVAEMAASQIASTVEEGHHMHVIVRPGNHDTQTTYYLGKLLEARFWNDDRVQFDVRPGTMQEYQFGKCGFVHVHGHSHASSKKGPDIKDEYRDLWVASTACFEVHEGHLHHEFVRDENGLLTRGMRALTLNDAWHKEAGYGATRGAQAFDYDYERGLEGIEYFTVPGQDRVRREGGLTT